MTTTITEQLAHLESALITLKSRSQSEATFSKENLQRLLDHAEASHPSTEKFECFGVRALASLLQEKIRLGYAYVDQTDAAVAFSAGNSWLHLVKPPEMLRSEHAAIEQSVREKYQSDINAQRAALIADIASTQLAIKELQEQTKAEAKRNTEYQKMLASVSAELCPVDVQQQSANTEAVVESQSDTSVNTDMETQ